MRGFKLGGITMWQCLIATIFSQLGKAVIKKLSVCVCGAAVSPDLRYEAEPNFSGCVLSNVYYTAYQ